MEPFLTFSACDDELVGSCLRSLVEWCRGAPWRSASSRFDERPVRRNFLWDRCALLWNSDRRPRWWDQQSQLGCRPIRRRLLSDFASLLVCGRGTLRFDPARPVTAPIKPTATCRIAALKACGGCVCERTGPKSGSPPTAHELRETSTDGASRVRNGSPTS